jgi:hypothetical protein
VTAPDLVHRPVAKLHALEFDIELAIDAPGSMPRSRDDLLPQEAPYAGQCPLSIALAPALGARGRCSALLVCQMVPFKVRSRQRLSSLTANST